MEEKDKWSNDTMCVLLWNVCRRDVLLVSVYVCVCLGEVGSVHPSV